MQSLQEYNCNNKLKKSYDLPLDLLQYRRENENSAKYLYS